MTFTQIARLENLALAAVDRMLSLRARRCPCCGWTGSRFRSFAVIEYVRRDVLCPRCGSFERHRALASFYPAYLGGLDRRPDRLIHLAPEPCLRSTLAAACDRYETSHFGDPAAADLHLDVTALALPDRSCDVLAMNHVLDCIPDDGPAIREMFRVLRPGGAVLAVVTFEPQGQTRELPVASNSCYRAYGPGDLERRFAPFRATVMNAAAGLSVEVRRVAGIPSTVPLLVLRKPAEA